jgi:hypothetical protein
LLSADLTAWLMGRYSEFGSVGAMTTFIDMRQCGEKTVRPNVKNNRSRRTYRHDRSATFGYSTGSA